MLCLYASVCVCLMSLALWSGPQYDYPAYMSEWSRVLGGHNPWINDPDNAYGPGHQFLAPLFWLHPLAPKALFVLSWFGCFIVIIDAAKRDIATDFKIFVTLFATPFLIILVSLFGSEDIFVTFLALVAIDGRTRKAHHVAPPLLLAAAALTKVYPLALVPFLATDRRSIDWRFIFIFVLTIAMGLALTIALWGWSISQVIRIESLRESKMLSVFWFLSQSWLSPLAHTLLAQALINWNIVILAVGMATLYAFHFLTKERALTGTLAASIILLILYKAGNPQYFILPTTLLIYSVAAQARHNDGLDCRLIIAAACYLLILNGFELWYWMTGGSFKFPEVRAAIGLHCFIAGVFLAWRVLVQEGRQCSP